MSYLRSFLFAFLVFGVVVPGLADTFTKNNCDKEVTSGSEYPKLSPFEEKLKSIKDKLEVWWKGKRSKIAPLNFVATINSFPGVQTANLILPGTLWCGDEDITKNKTDFNDTDACCRALNMCKNNIPSGETLENLNNTSLFTRYACTCDQKFYNCLKKDSSKISKAVGQTYFSVINPQCFICECPTEECKKDDDTECKDNCKKYSWVNNKFKFKF